MERRGDVELFLVTGVISSMIFFVGLFMGFSIGGQKMSILQNSINNLEQNIQAANLHFNVLEIMNESVSCDFMISLADELGTEASELGRRLEQMEIEGRMMTEDYTVLKRNYMVVLINDWVTIEEIKMRCETNMSTVLYFYSNVNCLNCEEQASVLNYYKKILDSNLMIFSLDADTDLTVINALTSTYSISEYPSLLVNGEVHRKYVSKTNMSSYLCDFSNYSMC